jgi:hypothetical protein
MGPSATRGSERQADPDRRWWLAAPFAVIGAALSWWALPPRRAESAREPSSPTVVTAASRRETRPTLDPARFVGKPRLAHQVARDIPDTLDQLYCYCACDKQLAHKSLLSCYTDGHAAT